MAVLLIADVVNGILGADSTAKTLTAVKSLGDVHILVAGANVADAAKAAAELTGATKVLVADDAAYANGLAEPMADLLVSLAAHYSHILAPATASAKNVLPRVAALMDVMIITDITAIIDADCFERPIYAGNAIQLVKSSDPTKIGTVRTASFEAAPNGAATAIENLAVAGSGTLSSWVADRVAASDRPELISAGIVVSGGRGVGSKDDFALIEKLADHMLAHGLIGSSLRPLAKAAGTSDRMLLYYFRDKEELLAATSQLIAARMTMMLAARQAPDLPIREISQPHLIQRAACCFTFGLRHAAPPAHARIARHAHDIECGCRKIPIHRSALRQIAHPVAHFIQLAPKKSCFASDARDQAQCGAQ